MVSALKKLKKISLKQMHHKESWAWKNWFFWTVVLEKTLQSPLDCKEIQPVHPKGGKSWVPIGRTDAKAERKKKVKSLSRARLFATPRTIACT